MYAELSSYLQLTRVQYIQTMSSWFTGHMTFPSNQQWQPSTSIAELQSFLGSAVTNTASNTKRTDVSGITKLDHTMRVFSW